jgi:glycosyltransferase involved in cell wall biosynthesis
MNIRIATAPAPREPDVDHDGPAPVAVVMAAYNAERTILQAVNSLLRGTFPCRIYIVDDCSQTPVADVLGTYDPEQIEIIRLARNLGPAAARNVALERILRNGHEFVAIMDADDVSHSHRLARQVAFLAAHPEIALVGCWERVIDEHTGNVVSHVALPCKPKAIRDCLFLKMCVSHPTWLMRTQVLSAVGLYSTTFRAAEDYELLRRIMTRFDVANVPEYLLDYRLSSGGISLRHRSRQLLDRMRIQARYFAPLNWRAWAGVLRTLALLVLRAKRRVPDSIGAPSGQDALQRV